MSLLSRFKIFLTLLAVIFLLAAFAVTASWLGVHAMASFNVGAYKTSFAAQRALEAARVNESEIALNRSEFRIASDPSSENRSAVRA